MRRWTHDPALPAADLPPSTPTAATAATVLTPDRRPLPSTQTDRPHDERPEVPAP